MKAEAPEQFLPESFNFPKETPHHKLDVQVVPIGINWYRCYYFFRTLFEELLEMMLQFQTFHIAA